MKSMRNKGKVPFNLDKRKAAADFAVAGIRLFLETMEDEIRKTGRFNIDEFAKKYLEDENE